MQFLRNFSVVPRLYWFKHLQKIRFEEKKIFNMTSSLTISEVYEMERRYLRLNSRWNIWEALENRFFPNKQHLFGPQSSSAEHFWCIW